MDIEDPRHRHGVHYCIFLSYFPGQEGDRVLRDLCVRCWRLGCIWKPLHALVCLLHVFLRMVLGCFVGIRSVVASCCASLACIHIYTPQLHIALALDIGVVP